MLILFRLFGLLGGVAAIALGGCSRVESEAVSTGAVADVEALAHIENADAEVAALLGRLTAAVEAQPANAERRGALGMAQEVNGFADAALNSYQRAEALAPDDPRWPYYQALLIAHGGHFDAALAHLDRSLALDSEHAPAWLWRGTWLLDAARYEQALAAFARAEALGAGVPAQAGTARALLRGGDAAAARDLLRRLVEVHPHPYLFKLLGQAQHRLGDVRAARSTLAKVERAVPLRWPDARSEAKRRFEASLSARLGEVREQLAAGELRAALATAERLQERHPDHQGLLNTLSEIYRRLGRFDDASAVLQRGVALHPDFYPFHLQLAEHYIREGQNDLAFQHLEHAVALNPAIPWIHAQRGLLLLERNRPAAALQAFAEALRQEPQQPQVHYYVAMTKAAGGRCAEATRSFAEAARLQPSFALAHIGLGRCFAEAGRFDESRVALQRAERIGSHAEETRAAFEFLRHRQAAAG